MAKRAAMNISGSEAFAKKLQQTEQVQ